MVSRFEITKASSNPLAENQIDKTDWDKSNKVVGFSVDIGPQNQSIFYGFNINQGNSQSTAEALQVLNQMANQGGNRAVATQNLSLYNLYKNRSYECNVEMMGCALIQPLMYFNIRNVPMFSGPYMITKVTHQIADNDFTTSFTGTRQPFYSLPKIDNFLQTLNIKILSTIQTKIQQREQQARQSPENIKAQQQNVIANLQSQDTLTKSQDCVTQINPRYRDYTGIDVPQQTSVTTKQLFETIKDVLVARGYSVTGSTTYLLADLAFSFIYVDLFITFVMFYNTFYFRIFDDVRIFFDHKFSFFSSSPENVKTGVCSRIVKKCSKPISLASLPSNSTKYTSLP